MRRCGSLFSLISDGHGLLGFLASLLEERLDGFVSSFLLLILFLSAGGEEIDKLALPLPYCDARAVNLATLDD